MAIAAAKLTSYHLDDKDCYKKVTFAIKQKAQYNISAKMHSEIEVIHSTIEDDSTSLRKHP